MSEFVVYLSTDRGRRAQESAVKRVVRHHRHTGATVVATYTELAAAIRHAKRAEATLIIGDLGSLTNDIQSLQAIHRADIDIIAADIPGADRSTLGVMIILARRRASKATRTTLAALLDLMHTAASVLDVIEAMNARAIRPPRGQHWTARLIAEVLDRADRQAERLSA